MIPREPEENAASQAELEIAEAEDTEVLKQALAEEKEKAKTNLAGWQRAQADLLNYKRRAEQEMEEVSKFANSTLVLSILPVLEDLERAFASIPEHLAKQSWVDGVKLIERKLRTTLESQGLTQIKAAGEPFDPNLHEAAMHGKGKEGIVIEELKKGYKFRERVIRPAMVVVGNGEEDRDNNKKGNKEE